MSLIQTLEEKFKTIEAKLNSNTKQNLITTNYATECNNINRTFDSLSKNYENGLNALRDFILKQLILKRDDHLKQVNERTQNTMANIKILSDAQKSSYLTFSPGLSSVYDSIMHRTNLEPQLSLNKLIKYSALTACKKFFRLGILARKCGLSKVKQAHKISTNKYIILFDYTFFYNTDYYVAVVNRKGEIIHLRDISNKKEYFSLNINATNAFAYYNDAPIELVDIYNFKLELLHSIKMSAPFECSTFHVHGYDVAFFDSKASQIAVYNHANKRLRKKEAYLDTSVIFGSDHDDFFLLMVNLNEKFVHFVLFYDDEARSLYALDRESLSFAYNIAFDVSRPNFRYIHEAQVFNFNEEEFGYGVNEASANGWNKLASLTYEEMPDEFYDFDKDKSFFLSKACEFISFKSIF